MAGEVNVLAPHWREVATHAVAFTAAVLVLRRYRVEADPEPSR